MVDEKTFINELDRTRIIATVVGMANAFDMQDWGRLRSLLCEKLDIDYSQFRGEAPSLITADAYVDDRRKALCGLKTLHTSTNHEVHLGGDKAVCLSAYHILRVNPDTEKYLETWGTYRHQLKRSAGRWRICGITQMVVRITGDPAIHGSLRYSNLDDKALPRECPK